MGRRGRLEGSLTKTGRAPSRARARDASSPSRRTLCISNIVESIGPLARSEGERSSPSSARMHMRLLASFDESIRRFPSSRRRSVSRQSRRPPAHSLVAPRAQRRSYLSSRGGDRPRPRSSRDLPPGAAVRTIVPSIAAAAAVGRPRRLLGDRRGICPWGGRKDDRPFDRDRRRDRRRGHPWERGDTAPPRRLP